MLMIKIEMWPLGDSSKKRDLAAIAIANVGGDEDVSDYEFWVSHQIDSIYSKGWESYELFASKRKGVWKRGRVEGFRRSLGAVRLLQSVLKKLR